MVIFLPPPPSSRTMSVEFDRGVLVCCFQHHRIDFIWSMPVCFIRGVGVGVGVYVAVHSITTPRTGSRIVLHPPSIPIIVVSLPFHPMISCSSSIILLGNSPPSFQLICSIGFFHLFQQTCVSSKRMQPVRSNTSCFQLVAVYDNSTLLIQITLYG